MPSGALSHGTLDRCPQLDSMRGVAAAVVVLHHFFLVWPSLAVPHEWAVWRDADFCTLVVWATKVFPLRCLCAGHEAVLLFFLLSGFALHRMLSTGTFSTFSSYLKRRCIRIYVPYLAALALAVLADLWLTSEPVPGTTSWFSRTWPSPFVWSHLLQHVLFVGVFQYDEFNTAFWSLVQEMRISLIFPLLFWILGRCRPKMQIAMAVAASLLGSAVAANAGRVSFGSFSYTLLYAALFMLGMLVSEHSGNLVTSYRRAPRSAQCALWSASLLLFFDADLLHKPAVMLLGSAAHIGADLCIAIGAAGLMIGALASKRAVRLLLRPSLRWLGQVSYSLYLVHATVLFALVHTLPAAMPKLAILPLYLTFALGSAVVFHKWIEQPSMRWSRGLRKLPTAADGLRSSKDLLPHVSV